MNVLMSYYLDLLDGCKQANKMVQEAVPLSQMMDVKTWLLPHTEELHNHSNPHIFKFYRNADGHAEMKYKHWTQDSWEPSGNQPGLKLLKVTKCSIINSIPRCVPVTTTQAHICNYLPIESAQGLEMKCVATCSIMQI